MTRLAYVDVVGGAAGDMLLAALIDAGASLEGVRDAVRAVLGDRATLETTEVRRGGLRARLLEVGWPGGVGEDRLPWRGLESLLTDLDRAAGLDDGVRTKARSVLERLGAAEAAVHGTGPGELALHDVGTDDTVLDAVGVAAALASLGVERLLVSSVPIASGGMVSVAGDHGDVPLPAPATLELMKGFDVRGLPHGATETVTPTAAAVFAALGTPAARIPAMTLIATGSGAGSRDPADRPNLVRVLIGDAVDDARLPFERTLTVLEANLDDLTPELVADAADALRAAGGLDVWSTPTLMKKGRAAVTLSALCEPAAEDRVRRAFFDATTTFGVRSWAVRRAELDRRVETVLVGSLPIRVKVGLLGGRPVTATPEHDDAAAVAAQLGRPVRDVFAEAAEAARALLLSGAPR
jgi:uncharacterized protein (TIGR00299 family) protein